MPDKDPHNTLKKTVERHSQDLRKYFLVAQYDGTSDKVPLTKQAKAASVKTTPIYNVDLYLLNYKGETVYHAKAHSGGWGEGPLPGLDKDIDQDPKNNRNAEYRLFNIKQDIEIKDMGNSGYQFENLSIKTHKVKGKTVADTLSENKGFMLRFASPEYTARGLSLQDMLDPNKKGAFGIHPDGKAKGNVGYKGKSYPLTTSAFDGTQGCIGLPPGISEKFAEIINNIPSENRPENLTVIDKDAKLSDFRKYVHEYNRDIELLKFRTTQETHELILRVADDLAAKADKLFVNKGYFKPSATPAAHSNKAQTVDRQP